MKFSLNLAQYYSNVDLKAIPKDELLLRMGAQLGAIEEVIEWAPKFEGAVIVRVAECVKHENADKLSVCMVDDGGKVEGVERSEDGLVQVVCGAPNVRAGMFAVWLPPGATVPSSREEDPFVLSARDIRGVVSNGMMASAHELGISEDHSGIVEVTAEDAGREPVPGEPVTAYFGLDDLVIDCENKMFTHRPDCFGNMGIAREVAGIFGHKFEDPEWYWKKPQFETANRLQLEVKNDIPELVPRFIAVVLDNIVVKPSPMWLQATLARVGIKPINNVVDVTNYVMHLTGQPLHAFDYDKLKERSNLPSLGPRMSQKGETLTLLGQKTIELTGEEIVIATDKQPVALAGVMGGAETEVDENTKTIVIECATFDMYSIRKTSMRFGLFTDAVTRFNKGQSPLQNDRVTWYAIKNMVELASAQQASDVYDLQNGINVVYLDQSNSGTVTTTAEFINKRLGSNLNDQEICGLLQNVHFAAFTNDSGLLEITAPFWRMDIALPEDIVEEVGRLHGFDKLPVELPARSSKATPKNNLVDLKWRIREKLKGSGANEVLTYNFVHGDLLKKTGTDPEKWAYHIRNALSPSLQYYRTALIPSLLDKVRMNLKSDFVRGDDNEFAIFEIGKSHVKDHNDDEGLPKEFERLALVVAADDKTAARKYSSAAYFQAVVFLERVLGFRPDLQPLEEANLPVTSSFASGRSALVMKSGEVLGVVGEFSASARKNLKLPKHIAGFELDLSALQNFISTTSTYRPLSIYPKTVADLTLEIPTSTTYAQLRSAVEEALNKSWEVHGYEFVLKPRDIFREENSDRKRVTFRIWLSHQQRTLRTDEVSGVLDSIATATEVLGAIKI